MAGEPISGREPSLGGHSELSGEEPFLGGEGSLAALLDEIGDDDYPPEAVLVARLANVIPRLETYLNGDDARARRIVGRMIGILAANHPPTREQTVPLLIRVIDDAMRSHDWPAAAAAVDRLGETADSRAATKLVELTSQGESYSLDGPLTRALGHLGTLALPLLMQQSMTGPYRARVIEASALREICASAPEAIPAVVRWLLPLILDSQGDEAAHVSVLLEWLSPAYLSEPLLEAVNDPAREMAQRVRVLYRVRRIHDPRVTSAMFDILNGNERPLWHIAAVVLMQVRFRQDIPRVLALIEHPDPDIRRYGIRIAGRRRIKASVPLVVRALAEPRAALRREAARALGRIGHPDGAEPLRPLLQDRAPTVRREAQDALSRIARNERIMRRRNP